METLEGKRIVVGVGGGIAAYKAAALVSRLRQRRAQVRVILTRAAAEFVRPLTFEALSHRPVLCDLFRDEPLAHVELAHEADLFVIAPATYDLIGKLANGLADDYLTTTLAATRAPVLLCPAMDAQMYASPTCRENLRRLIERNPNYRLLEPDAGPLASGREGKGRLPEPERILEEIASILAQGGRLAGKKVLVTAGPTRERLDPMRVLTNRSSGRMGYALAEAARELGAQVRLISGPTPLPPPPGVELVRVESAQQMYEQVIANAEDCDLILMAAAVSDWRPKRPAAHKVSKAGREGLTLELEPTPDILKALGERKPPQQFLVGFAAESEKLVEKARAKLADKKADLIVANDAERAAEAEENEVTLVFADGRTQHLPRAPKRALARAILDALPL